MGNDLPVVVAVSRWRVGRRVGRTIYEQVGPEPSDEDRLIGVMDTPDLAAEAVRGHNTGRDVLRAAEEESERIDRTLSRSREVREQALPVLREAGLLPDNDKRPPPLTL